MESSGPANQSDWGTERALGWAHGAFLGGAGKGRRETGDVVEAIVGDVEDDEQETKQAARARLRSERVPGVQLASANSEIDRK